MMLRHLIGKRREARQGKRPGAFARAAASLAAMAMLGSGAVVAIPALPGDPAPRVPAAQALDPSDLVCDYAAGDTGSYASSICWINFKNITLSPVPTPVSVELAGGARIEFDVFIEGRQAFASPVPSYWGANFGLHSYVLPQDPATNPHVSYLRPAIYQMGAGSEIDTTVSIENIRAFDPDNSEVTRGYAFVTADAEATNGDGEDNTNAESISWATDPDSTFTLISDRGPGYGQDEACSGKFTGEYTNSIYCKGGSTAPPTGAVVLSANAPTWIQAVLHAPQKDNKQAVAFGVMPSTVKTSKQVRSLYNDTDSFNLSVSTRAGKELKSTTSDPGAMFASTGDVKVLAALDDKTEYIFTETAGPDTDLNNYTTSYRCTNTYYPPGSATPTVTTPQVTPLSGTSVRVVVHTGDDVECTFTNTAKPKPPSLGFTKTVSPTAPGLVGDQFTYTIRALNNDKVNGLSGMVIKDTVPDGLQIVSTSPSATIAGQQITWANQSIAADTQRTYQVTVKALKAGQFVNNATADGPNGCTSTSSADKACWAKATINVASGLNLKLAKAVTSAPNPKPGDTVTYALTVTNTNGQPTPATQTVSDELPAALRSISLVGTNPDVTIDGNQLTWTIPAGMTEPLSIIVQGTIKDTQPAGDVVNTASLSGGCDSSGPTDNCQASATFTVTGSTPNIEVTKTGQAAVRKGTEATYTVTAVNTGQLATTRANTIIDIVPPEIDRSSVTVSAVPSGTASYDAATGQVTWTLPAGMLPAALKGTYQLTIKGTVLPTTSATSMSNTAALSPTQDCTTKCSSTVTTALTASAGAITLTKKAGPATGVRPGTPVTYSIQVANTGEGDLKDITVSDRDLPDDVRCPGGTSTIASLAQGQSVTCTLTHVFTAAEIAAGGAGWQTDGMTNWASADGTDANNVPVSAPPASATTRFALNTDVSLTKTANAPDPAHAGDRVSYEVAIAYDGDGDLTNVQLDDPMLPGLAATCVPDLTSTISPGFDATCTASKVLSEQDIRDNLAAGKITNTATLTGTSAIWSSQQVTKQASASVNLDKTTPTVKLTGSKVVAPAQVNPGGTVQYEVTITNAGQLTATNVAITDAFGGAGAAPFAPSSCTWPAPGAPGSLAPGATVTCTYPYVAAAGDAGRTVHNVVSASAKDGTSDIGPVTIGQADFAVTTGVILSIRKTNDAGTPRVKPGDPFNYQITVTNTGQAPASQVRVSDLLPAHLTPAATMSGWSWDAGTRILTSDPADIAGGGSHTFTIPVTVDAGAPGETTLKNVAAISGMTTPGACVNQPTTNGCAFDSSLTIDDASVTIAKTNNVAPRGDGTRVVAKGATFDYTVKVTNTGASQAGGVVVNDQLPAGLEFVSAPGGDWAEITPTTARSVPINVAGSSATTLSTLTVRVRDDAPTGVALLNVVALPGTPIADCVANPAKTGCGKDPNPPQVQDNSKVEISKANNVAGDPKLVRPGEKYTYSITVHNGGTTTAYAVQVSDTIDTTKLSFDPAQQASAWAITGATFSLKDPVDLAPSQTLTYDIEVQVKQGASGTIGNVAVRDDTDPGTCDASPQPSGCGVDPEPPTIDNSALELTKTSQFQAPGQKVKPGQQFTYTLRATNSGKGDALGVQVVDQIPAGVDFYPLSQLGWTLVSGSGGPDSVIRSDALAKLGESASHDFTFTVRVRSDATADSTVRNIGTVGPTPIAGCVGNPALPGCAEDKNKPVIDDSSVSITKTNNVPASGASRYVKVGDTFRYTLTLANAGQSAATGIVVADQLPPGLAFDPASQGGWQRLDAATGTATSQPLTIPGGGTEVYLYLDVKVVGPLTPGDQLTNVAANTSVVPLADCVADTTKLLTGCAWDSSPVTATDHSGVTIAKVNDVATAGKKVRVGDPFTYTISVKNTGKLPALGVQVSDTIDSSKLTLAPSQASVWAISGNTVSLKNPVNLASDEEQRFDVAVIVKDGAAGTIGNVAVLDDTDPATCPPAQAKAGCGPDLDPPSVDNSNVTITKKNDVDGNRVRAGAPITYTFTAVNSGTDPATITITDLLPAGLTLTPATQAGWGTLGAGRRITSSPITVPARGEETLDLTVTVAPGTNPLTLIRNAGSIDGTTDVATCLTTPLAKGCAVDETLIVDDSDLAITKKNSFDPATQAYVQKDEPFTYTLRVSNPGSLDLDKVVVADQLPAGLVLDGQQDPTRWASAPAGGKTATSVALTVPAKSGIDLVLKVKSDGTAASGDTLTNVAAITTKVPLADCVADQQHTTPYCAWDTAAPKATDLSGITMAKSNDLPVPPGGALPRVVVGQKFNYVITVTNTKPSPARGVVATDYLPSGIQAVQPLPAGWHLTGTKLVSDPFDMAAGAQPKVFTIPVTVAAGAEGVLRNAVVKGDDPPPGCESDPTLPGCDQKPPRVDTVVLTKTATPARVHTGGIVTYTFTVTNTGSQDVPGYRIIDSIPRDTTLEPNPQAPEWQTVSGAGGEGTIVQSATPFTVPRSSTVLKTLTVKVADDAPAGERLINVATMEGGRTPITGCVQDPALPDCIHDTVMPVVDDSSLTLTKVNDVRAPQGYPRLVKPGESFTYSIEVKNSGKSEAEGIEITDQLPAGLAFDGVQADPWKTPAGSVIQTNPFTLAGGATRTLSLKVRVLDDAKGLLKNVSAVDAMVTIDECDRDATLPGCGVDDTPPKVDEVRLETTKAASIGTDEQVRPGQKFSYDITVSNKGTGPATGVRIADLLPAGLQLDPDVNQAATWSYNAATRIVTSVDSYTIVANGATSLTLAVQVLPTATGGTVIHNVGTIHTDDRPGTDPPTCASDPTLPGCFEEPGDHPVNDSKITITKKNSLSSPPQVQAGDTFTYQIVVANTGSQASRRSVTVNEELPAGLVFAQAPSPGQWASYDQTAGTATSVPLNLKGGDSATLNLSVKVTKDATAGSRLVNVSAIESMATIAQCRAAPATDGCGVDATPPTVIDHSAVTITKVNSIGGAAPSVKPGGTFSYTITVKNTDLGQAVRGVQVSDTLPAFLSFDGPQPGWLLDNLTARRADLIDLGPGGERTFTLSVKVADPASGDLRNVATLDDVDPATCISTGNPWGCAVDSKPVHVDNTNVSITKKNSVDGDRVRVLDEFDYTFTATNTGSEKATGVTITDKLPAGLEVYPATQAAWGTFDALTRHITSAPFEVGAGGTFDVVLRVRVADGTAPLTKIVNAGSLAGTTPVDQCFATPLPAGCAIDPKPLIVDDSALTITKVNNLGRTPSIVMSGESFAYTLKVTNTGQAPAAGVTVTDQLPAGLQLDGPQDASEWAQAPAGASKAVSQPFDLAGRGFKTLTLKVKAGPGASPGDTLTNVAAAAPQAMIEQCLADAGRTLAGCAWDPAAPQLVDHSKVQVAKVNLLPGQYPKVKPGQVFTYQVTATNTDSVNPALGVRITDQLPAGLSFVLPLTGWELPTGQDITSQPFDLIPGGSKTLTLQVKVADDASGTLRNVAVKDSDPPPDCATNPALPGCDPRPPAVDTVTLTKKGEPARVKPGGTITYTFTADNTAGKADVMRYRIIDSIPGATSLAPGQGADWQIVAGTGTGGPGTIVQTVTPFTVPKGEVVTVKLNVVADQGAKAGTVIRNVATMEGGRTPIQGCVEDAAQPDCITDTTKPVVDDSNLTITKVNDVTPPAPGYPKTVKVGDTFTYRLVIANSGVADATGVTVSDRLPAGLQFASQQDSAWQAPSGRTIQSKALVVPGKGDITLPITVTVSPGASGTLKNVSAIDSMATIDECDLDPMKQGCGVDNQPPAVDNTKLVPAKTASIGPDADVKPGQRFSYEIEIANQGNGQATGVKVRDLLPVGLQLDPDQDQRQVWAFNPATRIVSSVQPYTIGAGATQRLTLYVQVAEGTTAGTIIRNAGSVATDTQPGTDPPSCKSDPTLPGCFEEPGGHEVNDSAITLTKRNSLASPFQVLVGQEFSYTIRATNSGESVARGVAITDQLPAGLVFASQNQAGWVLTGTRAVARPVDIPGKGFHDFTVLVKVDASATVKDTLVNVAALNGEATPESCIETPRPGVCAFDTSAPTVTDHSAVSYSKTSDLPGPATGTQPRVKPGDTFTYTISAVNTSAFAATGVRLSDTLPAGLSLAGPQDQRWIITGGGRTLSFITDMAAGERIDLKVAVQVDSGAEGTLRNAVVLDDGPPPGCVTDPAAPGCDPKPPYVDTVTPSKTSSLPDGARVRPGDQVTYTFSAINAGTQPVSPYGFIDKVPAGMSIDQQAIPGWRVVSGTGGAGTVVMSEPAFSVPGKSSVTRTLTMTVAPTATDGMTIRDVGTVINGKTGIDTCVDNPTLPDCYREPGGMVVDLADVTLVKTNSVTQSHKLVRPGQKFSYSIVASNRAPTSDAQGVQITDLLPAYLAFDGQQDTNVWQPPNEATRTIQSKKLTIPAGGEITLRLNVVVLPGASGQLTNAAAVDSKVTPGQCLATPTLSGCGVDTQPVQVDNTVISATKTASIGDGAPVRAGQTFEYQIEAANSGSQPAGGVKVTDQLPAQVELVPSADFPGPATATGQVTSVAFDLPAAAPSAPSTRMLTLRVKVKDNAAAGSLIHNIGAITKPEDDGPSITECVAGPDQPQCFEEKGDHAVDDSNITVTKANSLDGTPPYVKAGETFTYDLVVKNSGTQRDSHVQVADQLPAGLSFDPASQPGWVITGRSAVSSEFVLDGGAQTTLRLSVKVDTGQAAGTRLRNVAAASGTTSGGTPVDQCAGNPALPGCGVDPNPPLVSDSSSLSLTKVNSLGTDPVVTIGQSYTYTLTATNTSATLPVKRAEVSDTLPAGLAFDSLPSGWQADANGKAWIKADFDPGQSRTWTLGVRVMSGASGTLYNVVVKDGQAPGRCDGPTPPPECDPEPPEVDPSVVSIAKASDLKRHAKVKPGQEFSYTLTATNTGEGPATGRTLSDTLPAGLDYVKVTGDGWTWNEATRTLTSTAFGIPAGESVSRTVTVKVNTSNQPGAEIENTGCVVFRDTETCEKDPDPPSYDNANIVLTKANDTAKWDGQVRVGDSFTYTLTATNNGGIAATGVTLSDTLPTGLAFDPAGAQPGWQSVTASSATSGTLTIEPGEVVTLTLKVKVTSAAVVGATLRNVAVVDGVRDPAACDANPKLDGCGVDPEPPTVVNLDDVAITKVSDKPGKVVRRGDPVTYTITVTNNASQPRHNVPVFDTLPAGLEFYPASQDGWLIEGQRAAASIPLIGARATAELTLRARVTEGAPEGELRNVSVIGDRDPQDCLTNPGLPRCGTDIDPPRVNPTSITLSKASSLQGSTTVQPGQVFSYTITAANSGGTGGPVIITDKLPDGLEFYPANQPPWVIDTAAAKASVQIPQIAAGAQASRTLQVRVKAGTPHGTEIKNAAVVHDPRDPDGPVPIDTCLINPKLPECGVDPDPPLVNAKVMQIEKRNDLPAGTLLVGRGREFAYVITVRNLGAFDARGVQVTDRLPDGLEWAASSQPGWSAFQGKDAISAPVTVAAKSSVQLNVKVRATKTSTTRLRNVVALSAFSLPGLNVAGAGGWSVSDPTGDIATIAQCLNDPTRPGCAYDDVAGSGQRDGVTVAKANDAAGGTVKRGQSYAYTLTVTNASGGSSEGITLTDALPQGLTFAGTQDPAWVISADRKAATLKEPFDLGAGQSRTFHLTVTVGTDAAGTLRNIAVMDDTPVEDCALNPALPGCGVDPSPPVVDPGTAQLRLAKKAATSDKNRNGVMDAGDLVSYTFEVTNTGRAAAKTALSIDDPMLATAGIAIICPDTPIAPGATLTCKAQAPYVLSKADQAAGQLRNIATAGAGDATSRPAGVTVRTSGVCEAPCPAPSSTLRPWTPSASGAGPAGASGTTRRLPYTGGEIAATAVAAMLLAAGGLIARALGRRNRMGDLP